MPKRARRERPSLMVRVWAELGAGRMSEKYIKDGPYFTDGFCDGQHIIVNPAHQTVDTVIHEILHRLFPAWKEAYVRNRTTYLRNRMTDDEVRAFFDEYNKRVKRPKRNVVELT